MTRFDTTRIGAVVGKELREYRRRRAIVATMIVLPFVFLIQPTISIFFGSPAGSVGDATYYGIPLLFLLMIPVIMPSTLAAYSVAGEREQGTLEPLLTTPIRKREFIFGKAAAVMIPTLALCYTVSGLFLAAVRLFAKPAASSGVFHQGPILLALVLFTPLLAGWAIVVGMAVSVRVGDVRVAQQLATLASLPPIAVVALMATGVIPRTFTVAVLLAVALLVVDLLALRIISGMFDRERLVTGAKSAR